MLNLKGNKIIPVIKLPNAESTLPLLDALKAGGITIAEITYRSVFAPAAIRLARQERPDILVGAGTVLTETQCLEAIGMGAQFIVSPGFSEGIAKICKEARIPLIPGCVTPTEIMTALSLGAEVIKFFPAEQYGGVSTLKALSAPFAGVKFIPTGGVSAKNIADYLALPNVVACGGSWMVKESLIQEKNWAEITVLAKEGTEAIK